MRWFWIDRFDEFVRGERATAVKNVSMAEPAVQDHFPSYPCLPSSLIVEGLAQTGGLLVAQTSDFREKVVLAKVGKARFESVATPGDTLRYAVKVASLQDEGAVVDGRATVDDRLVAEVQLVFAYLGEAFHGVTLFDPVYLGTMLSTLGIFQVGRTPDGAPLEMPSEFRSALERTSGDRA